MKRTTLIIAAIAASTLSGCDMGGSGFTAVFPVRTETTEVVTTADGTTNTFVTNLSYDKEGWESGQVTTKNGNPYIEMKDYVKSFNGEGVPTQTITRVTTNDDGTTVTHRLFSTYGVPWGDGGLETRFELLSTGITPAILEWRTVEYNNNQITRYETMNNETGESVLRERYRYGTSPKPTQTYTETRRGPNGVLISSMRMGLKISMYGYESEPFEYELYQNVPDVDNWNGTDGDLIEEKIDFSGDEREASWTIKKYEWVEGDDGEQQQVLISTTRVENEYQDLTINYN